MTMRRIHPVYKVINKPLTVFGASRELFFLAAMTGLGVFNLLQTLVGGIVLFTVLLLAARYATRKDPQILRVLMRSGRFRKRYDPVKLPHEMVTFDA